MNNDPYPKFYLYRRIVQSKLFIDDNFGQNIDVECIADQASFSKFHFIRLFKKIYGKTPHQYLISVRIGHAKELLSKNISVTDVCPAVGFESLSSFIGLFKSVVGETPSAWQRRRHQVTRAMAQTPLRFIPGCFIDQRRSPQKSNFQEADR